MGACRKQLLQEDKKVFFFVKQKKLLYETQKQTYLHCILGEEIPPGMKQYLKSFQLGRLVRLKKLSCSP